MPLAWWSHVECQKRERRLRRLLDGMQEHNRNLRFELEATKKTLHSLETAYQRLLRQLGEQQGSGPASPG